MEDITARDLADSIISDDRVVRVAEVEDPLPGSFPAFTGFLLTTDDGQLFEVLIRSYGERS
jgi:hypothetical protein